MNAWAHVQEFSITFALITKSEIEVLVYVVFAFQILFLTSSMSNDKVLQNKILLKSLIQLSLLLEARLALAENNLGSPKITHAMC